MGKFSTTYQEFIYKRSYSRWDEEKGRRENWLETVARYDTFFTNTLKTRTKDDTAMLRYKQAIEAIKDFEIMPSMRALWSSGKALERENVCAYNCSAFAFDKPKRFSELLYVAMAGAGTGFSVERQFISKLPEVPELHDIDEIIIFKDSRIGWAEGFNHFIHKLYDGQICKWDLSQLRPKGAVLKTFGGRSSGKEPLEHLLKFTVSVFKKASSEYRKLNSLEVHDIACMIANCVVSGGTRRTACISFSNLSDSRMANAKTGEFWLHNDQRRLANNSVAYTEKPDIYIFTKEWEILMNSKSGERGIFNRDGAKKHIRKAGRRDVNHEFLTNPCLSGDTLVYYKEEDHNTGCIYRNTTTIKELSDICAKGGSVVIYDGEKDVEINTFRKTGENKQLFRIKFTNGMHVDATINHSFFKKEGLVINKTKVCELRKGDSLLSIDSPFVIEDISLLDGLHDVYCCTVPTTNAFTLGNNLISANCGEVILRPNSFCNLTEVIIRDNDSLTSLLKKVEHATILGCIQALLTDFKFIGNDWRKNTEEERLVGVSLSGMLDHPVLNNVSEHSKEWLNKLRRKAIKVSEEWAKLLGINAPAMVTVVKPSGTVSQLVNSSSGIHPRFAPYYIRRVRVSATDPVAHMLKEKGVPCNPEVNQNWTNCNTIVFDFPIESPKSSIIRNQRNAIEQLEYWKMVKECYTEGNPSCTIYVKDDEWLDVGAWVYRNFDNITGVSFLPYDNSIYPLLPYEEITEDKYKELSGKFPSIDFTELVNYEKADETEGAKELACAGGVCEL